MKKYNINNNSYSIPETKEEFIKGKKDMYIVSFKNGTYKKAPLDNESLKIKSDKKPSPQKETSSFEKKYTQSLENWCQKTTDKKTGKIKRKAISSKFIEFF